MVNGVTPNQRPIRTDVPQGSVFGTDLCIFINDLDERIECAFCNIANNTALGGSVDMLEVRKSLRRDLDSLE